MMTQHPRTTGAASTSSSTNNPEHQQNTLHSQLSTTNTAPPKPSAPAAASVASYQQTQVTSSGLNPTIAATPSMMLNIASTSAYNSQLTNPLGREFESQKLRNEKEIELEKLRDESLEQQKINLKLAPIAINVPDYAKQVAELFNSYNIDQNGVRIPSAVTRNAVKSGLRIENDEFRLVSRNNVPELLCPSDGPTWLNFAFMPGQKAIDYPIFKQSKDFFGACGRYVLNVPDGQYAQGFQGPNSSKPFFYGPGTHIITDVNFKLATTHFVNKAKSHIAHGNLHILNVPEGQLAQVILNGKHKRLIPAGEWFFDDNGFELVPNGDQEFINENERLIKFGPIIRFIPPANHTAVISRNGVYEFYEPGKTTYNASGVVSSKSIAYEINDPNAIFFNFYSKERRDLKLPSKKVMEQNKRTNKPEWAGYEQYVSQDNTSLGTKIHCAYSIQDIAQFLSKGNLESLEEEMESYISSQVGNWVRNNKYADFHHVNNPSGLTQNEPSSGPLITRMRKSVLENTEEQFAQWGVKIAFLTVEPPSILDETLAQQLNQATIATGQLNAEVTRLENERIKAIKHAEQIKAEAEIKAQQDANVSKINQEQESQNKQIVAEAEKAIAILKAQQISETSRIDQERDNQNAQSKAETEKKVALIQQEKDNAILQAKAETTKKVAEIDQSRDNANAQSKAEAAKKVAISEAEACKVKADAAEYTKNVAPVKASQAGELAKTEMQSGILKQEIENLTIQVDKLKQLLDVKIIELDIKKVEIETANLAAIALADNDAYKNKTAGAKAEAESMLIAEQFKQNILEQEQLNLAEKKKQLELLKETKTLELEVRKIEADIQRIDIELDKAKKLADLDVKNQKRETKAAIFTQNPAYANYKTAKTQQSAWGGGRLVVISPEVAKNLVPNSLFSVANPLANSILADDQTLKASSMRSPGKANST